MRRRRSEADFAAEIQAHIALETDRLVEEGMPPEEARAAAIRRFGSTLAATERLYESRRWMWLDRLAVDLRHAARGLARYPLSCLVAVVSLAAGIGATTVTSIVGRAVFDSPPPLYAEPERLSVLGVGPPDRFPAPVPAGLFALWTEDGDPGVMIAAAGAPRTVEGRFDDRREPVTVRPVSPNLFALLGVPAALGRTFDVGPDDGGQAATPVVLSDAIWRNLFAGRADVIGRVVWLDEVPYSVIGVMPARFWLLSMDAPLWTPLDARTLSPETAVTVVARRPAGMSGGELAQRLQAGAATYQERAAPGQHRMPAVAYEIGGTPVGRNVGPMILVLLGTSVVLTLLIACTNVAMLMIAQWTTREHEIAIRASLGASRGRIVRGLVAESLLIASLGGGLGTSVTLALLGVVRRGADAGFFNLSIDYRTVLATALVTVAAGIATGLAPALYETRLLEANPLRQLRRSDRVRQRWRHALVVFEIAVTVALLVVAGALLSAARRTMTAQPGFDTHALAGVRLDNATGISIPAVLDRLAGLPGVARVAAASHVPIVAPAPRQPIALDRSGTAAIPAERTFVGPGFFETLGVPLRAGRAFTERDDAHGPRVALVNDTLAARLWPGGSPIGAQVWSGDVAYQVVGVVAGYGNTALRRPRPALYLPIAQAPALTRLFFVVRAQSAGDLMRTDWRRPGAMEDVIRREVRAAGPAAIVASTFTVDAVLDIGSRELLVGTVPLAPLIATGLLLTAAGIFSVLAFSIARRANELAVRVAVGAEPKDLVRLVAVQSARLVGMGLAAGIAVTFAVSRIAQGTGSVFDSPGWQAFVVPIAIVGAIGVMATWMPLRRAMHVNPAALLRAV